MEFADQFNEQEWAVHQLQIFVRCELLVQWIMWAYNGYGLVLVRTEEQLHLAM